MSKPKPFFIQKNIKISYLKKIYIQKPERRMIQLESYLFNVNAEVTRFTIVENGKQINTVNL